MAIFNSYVKLPEGIHIEGESIMGRFELTPRYDLGQWNGVTVL